MNYSLGCALEVIPPYKVIGQLLQVATGISTGNPPNTVRVFITTTTMVGLVASCYSVLHLNSILKSVHFDMKKVQIQWTHFAPTHRLQRKYITKVVKAIRYQKQPIKTHLWYLTNSFRDLNFTDHKKYFPLLSRSTLKCWMVSSNLKKIRHFSFVYSVTCYLNQQIFKELPEGKHVNFPINICRLDLGGTIFFSKSVKESTAVVAFTAALCDKAWSHSTSKTKTFLKRPGNSPKWQKWKIVGAVNNKRIERRIAWGHLDADLRTAFPTTSLMPYGRPHRCSICRFSFYLSVTLFYMSNHST